MTPDNLRTTLTFLAITAAASSPAQSYRLTDLGTLGGHASYAAGANASGQVVGFSSYNFDENDHAYLFSDGVMQDLGTLGGTSSYAYGINGSGQVVGTATTTGDASSKAFRFSGAAMQDLGTLGGTFSNAYGVNDSGQVVGDAALSGDTTQHAFIFSGSGLVDLGTLGGASSTAYGINASGEAVGYADLTAPGVSHAFRYSAGAMQDLGTLGGGSSTGRAINALGQVVGDSTTLGETLDHAFLYSAGAMHDLGTLGGTYSNADAINAVGQIVGVTSLLGDHVTVGFLYTQGAMLDLNSLVDSSGAGITVTEAYGIDDSGYIAADATLADGSAHAVLLTPYYFDDPTSYSLYRGVYYSGSLSSLFSLDKSYLVALSGPTLNSQEPPISIVINGTSTLSSVSDLRVSVTAHTNTPGLRQSIELWDFQASAWVLAGAQNATTSDSLQTAIETNPSRFVETGTSAIRARVSWKQIGPTLIYRWGAYVDQVLWNVSP